MSKEKYLDYKWLILLRWYYIINWWISLDKTGWNSTFFSTLYCSRCKRNRRFSWCIFRMSITSYDGWFVKGINAVSQNRNSRVFLSHFFFFFLHPRRSHNFPPCIFIEKNMRMTVECNFQVSFKCRSSKLTWEAIVGEESCWRSERQSVPRHVRHFEDQCQDRGKKTDAWTSLQPYQPFWNEKKATTMRDTHVANVSFSSFFVPFLCHRLPNRGCVATDDVV